METWKDIPGYLGVYQVSDKGRVRSLDRVRVLSNGRERRLKGKVLTPSTGLKGYQRVILYTPGGSEKTMLVHRAVLLSFEGESSAGSLVLHGDGDPRNNELSNLRWGTHSDNMHDRVSHGRDPNAVKSHCPRGHRLAGSNIRGTPANRGRRCVACHRAKSDQYNGSGLSFAQLADMRYYMLLNGLSFAKGERRKREGEMWQLADGALTQITKAV